MGQGVQDRALRGEAVNVVAKGFEASTTGLRYQTLSATSFDVRMEESITDLIIPIKRSGPISDNARNDPDADADSIQVLAEFERNLEKPVSVTLVGRVLKDGKPRPGVTMALYRSAAGSPDRIERGIFAEVVTDDLGRYAIPGLSAGDGYHFRVHPGDESADPGWRYQSPYHQTIRPGKAGFIRLPDIRLIDRGQSLSGVVVDPKGTPISGVTVTAKVADTYTQLPRTEKGPPSWMETDAQGRFELRQLPNLPIELMAHVRNRAGGRILHPAIYRPGRDQADIRILFDPTLAWKPRDLDAAATTRHSR